MRRIRPPFMKDKSLSKRMISKMIRNQVVKKLISSLNATFTSTKEGTFTSFRR
jgi:hypothetical protein